MAEQTTGTVFLVGAGPGDPELLTLKAKRLIESCDVLVYDYLANAVLKSWTKPGCELLYVGKKAGFHALPQSEIEDLLIRHASAGKSVVRLKGGDPFVFGRGGEEALRLKAVGLDFEIVPAVTAALGSAAYAGIPLTHRDYSSAMVFLTGHENTDKESLYVDFEKYASIPATLCIYMGMGHLAEITEKLIRGGRSADTPVAVVQWATTPRQRSVCATLATIADAVAKAELGAPAVVIVGEVAKFHREINWFEARPLFGKRVVVTRNKAQAGKLRGKLEALGAEVLELPLISVESAIEPDTRDDVFREMATYEWLVFTSPNGVRMFFDAFFSKFQDLRCLGPMRIACVGKSTATEVERYFLQVDIVPDTAVAEALADAILADFNIEHSNVLVVTGNRNRDVLVKKLEDEGKAIVDVFPVYKTNLTNLEDEPVAADFRQKGADAITFTSASTVESFVQQAKHLAPESGARFPKAISIGPITSEAMRKAGLPVDAEASQHDLDGLVLAIVKKLTGI